jgi:hypothetical protein
MKYFLIFSYFIYINSVIILPFKRIFNETMNENNIFKLLLNNNIVSEIKIGTPSQSLPLSLKTKVFSIDISSNNCPTQAKTFDFKKSKTFVKYEEYEDSPYAPEPLTTDADESKDSFIINDNNLTLNFFLYNTTTNYESGVLGIGLGESNELYNDYNFIYQIKNKNIIKSFAYTIHYEKKDSGKIIIGEFPHEYNKQIYNIKDLISINSIFQTTKIFYDLSISTIIFGEEKIEENFHSCELEIENGFIRGTKKLNEYLQEKLLKEYLNKKICFIQKENDIKTNSINTFFYCKENINIPNLKFVSRTAEFTFELNENDLFYKYKGNYYLLIYFNSLTEKCILGKPFFYKYQLTFDQEKKTINFYTKINKEKSKFSIAWFLVVILFIIICILIYYIFKFLRNKIRKIKANELEENIDYTPENQYIVL